MILLCVSIIFMSINDNSQEKHTLDVLQEKYNQEFVIKSAIKKDKISNGNAYGYYVSPKVEPNITFEAYISAGSVANTDTFCSEVKNYLNNTFSIGNFHIISSEIDVMDLSNEIYEKMQERKVELQKLNISENENEEYKNYHYVFSLDLTKIKYNNKETLLEFSTTDSKAEIFSKIKNFVVNCQKNDHLY